MRYAAVGWANCQCRRQELVAGEGERSPLRTVFAQPRHRIVVINRGRCRTRFVAGVVPHGGVVIIGASVLVPRTPFRRSRCLSSGPRTGRPPYVPSANAIRASRNRLNRLISDEISVAPGVTGRAGRHGSRRPLGGFGSDGLMSPVRMRSKALNASLHQLADGGSCSATASSNHRIDGIDTRLTFGSARSSARPS